MAAFNADFIETVQAYGPALRAPAAGDSRELSKLTSRHIDFCIEAFVPPMERNRYFVYYE